MKGGERQTFSIKCECIILRNNTPINTKKKSKFSVIELDPITTSLLVMPYGVKKEEEKPFQFSLTKLRAIHKKYIEEGKITLQFFEKTERLTLKGIDVSANDNIVDVFSSILISSASKENLQLLISKIIDLKKSQHPKDSKKKIGPSETTIQKPSQKRRISLETPNPYQPVEKFNRKDLRQMANHPVKIEREKTIRKIPVIDFFDIPLSLRAIILEYCTINLEMRLINKKFSNFVLENIHSIRLKDEIDEASFNKLAMWAVNIECRMKNVRNITLRDKNQEQQLLENRAKTLRFGQWKEITAKNILQLKGLRTYCIQLPFSMKFDLSHLFGQRLVELRLKGAPFSRNELVKVQDLAHILRSIRELKALELPFCTSSLFPLIDFPDRIQQLSIYSISDNISNSDWTDMTRFSNLLVFNCWYLQKGGVRKETHEIQFLFPQRLSSLQIGSFLSNECLSKLPFSLRSLKLIGNFFNRHLEDIVLPFLKQLDISEAKNIRGEVLEYLSNITLTTSWDRNTVDYMNKYAVDRNIILQTTANPFK